MIVDNLVATITVSAVTGPAQTDNFEHPGSGYSMCSRCILATKPGRRYLYEVVVSVGDDVWSIYQAA